MTFISAETEKTLEKNSPLKAMPRTRAFLPTPLFFLVAAFVVVFFMAGGYLPVWTQMMMGGILLGIVLLLGVLQRRLKGTARIFLLLVAAFLSLRYWLFRTFLTIGIDKPIDFTFALLLYLAESYGILIHVLGMVVNIWPTDREPEPLSGGPDELPPVDVFIPTYNEPPDLVRITATAALQMAYPRDKLRVFILDDGATRSFTDGTENKNAEERSRKLRSIAAEIGAVYHARKSHYKAKAGNINEALFQLSRPDTHGGELILVLDCDHVPTRDFLEKTVGFFQKDPKLFLVQTPHYFINPGPVERNLEIFRKGPSENEMFYGVIQRGLDFWNSSFFCGSAALLRRSHLMAAGGLSVDTITEDVETSMKLHAMGLNSVYLFRPMVIGLSPETYDNFIVQRSRWAQGMVQILRLKNPLLQKGLTVPQRIGYFNSCFFWFFGLARMIFYLSPMLFLMFGLRIYNASLLQVLAYCVPHLIGAFYAANQLYGRYRHPFFSEFYETVQSFYLAPAIIKAFIRPKTPVFHVTPKALNQWKNSLSHLALPFYVMVTVSIVAQVVGWLRWHNMVNVVDALLLCSLWNVFNIFLLLCCLGVVWERSQRRAAHRFPVTEPASVSLLNTGEEFSATVLDLSSIGFSCYITGKVRPAPESRLVLRARDNDGNRYELPSIVKNAAATADGFKLGCLFVSETSSQRERIVAYVFGESRRWRYFGEDNPGPAMSNSRGLAQLFRLGFLGFLHNFLGIFQLLMSRIKAPGRMTGEAKKGEV